jgi:hypothetical protein
MNGHSLSPKVSWLFVARGLVGRRTAPFGCSAVANPNNAVCLSNRDCRVWGRFATQRGQAPSPQKLVFPLQTFLQRLQVLRAFADRVMPRTRYHPQ